MCWVCASPLTQPTAYSAACACPSSGKPSSIHSVRERRDQPLHVGVGVLRAGGEAQALGAARDGRVVDRLHVDGEALEQRVGDALGEHGVADQDRHDVAGIVHHRQAGHLQPAFQRAHALLVPLALGVAGFEVADAGDRAGGNGGRQRGREDEARGVGADGVADVGAGGDVAAHDAEALGQRAVDDVDAVHDPVALGKPAAAGAVEADGVHLVEIGERAVLLRPGRRWRRSAPCCRPSSRRTRRR